MKTRLPMALYLLALAFLVLSGGYAGLNIHDRAVETAANRVDAKADLAAELVANTVLSLRLGPAAQARSLPDVAIVEALDNLSLSEGQSIAVLDGDSRVVARLSALSGESKVQGTIINEAHTRRFIASDAENQRVVMESPLDGLRRFYSFQRVRDTGYTVVVGEKASLALQGWRHSLWAGGIGFSLVALVGFFFLKQFYRRLEIEAELRRDVAERELYAAELQIASRAFQTHLGLMITDQDGVILRANRAFTRITGYEEQDVVGKTPRILQSGLQDVSFYSQLWSQVQEAGSWEGEIWNRRKNGEVFAEWLTITAVHDESGTVRNYVGTFHDITSRKEAEKEANRLAFYDSLTGLANRALLEEKIASACAVNSRQPSYAALLYLDIEQLRAINDAWGYSIGDQLLKAVALRLGAMVRRSDTLARIGGDEFALLLTGLDTSRERAALAAEGVAAKINAIISETALPDHQQVQIEVSIGITLVDGGDSQSDQHLQRAEQATQQAKDRARSKGEKRIAFFDPRIQQQVVEHLLLEDELANALARNELVVVYQPQIAAPVTLMGYEVLLRWRHPEKGMISPGVFIPIAEQSRLILPIGLWVLEQACQKLAAWQADPLTARLGLSVNVSVVQFQSDDLVAQISEMLDRTGAPPHLLKLEVTESLLMNDPDRITRVMDQLRLKGIRFSLDDFGTGYSSMSYLNRLPLDQIKIDQSFVRDVTTSAANAAIVESVVGLAQGLGLEVIAEGVETEAQRQWLVDHGCLHFQGYLFGRPVEDVQPGA